MTFKSILTLFFTCLLSFSLSGQEKERIQELSNRLDSLSTSISGLNKKVDFSISQSQLSTFVRAIAENNKVNVSIAPELNQIQVSHNFSNATVKNVLLYLCREYKLTIDVLGSILSIKKYKTPFKSRDISLFYDNEKDLFSIDLQSDTLHIAFKKITNDTGKNLVFAPGIGNQTLSFYTKNKPFENAIDKMAFANNLIVTKTKDNYYLFESATSNITGIADKRRQKPARFRNTNFYFKVQDSLKQLIDVDFENTPISSIVNDIGFDLGIDMFTSSPLSSAGNATVKANLIRYDVLLNRILENTKFSFNKINGVYYFGENTQSSLINTETVPLLHRSIEIMNTPIQSNDSNLPSNNLNNQNTGGIYTGQNLNNQNFNNNSGFNNNANRNSNFNNRNRNTFENYESNTDAILDLIPKAVKDSLEISTDVEQNAFIVHGNAQKIEAFKSFLNKIDKPVPVILIEVMIVEVSNSNSVSTGLDLGIGDAPTKDNGTIFPSADLTLGATSINKIIGGFNGFGSLNIGKVTENFYARIQALETNGDLKIRSTPKLSTLNGHQAMLTRGETTYYAVTRRDVIGSQNPQTIEIKNYYPIDANLSIGIRPLVSGDNNITLSINVTQSDFNNERIDPEAPPGMNSREFTSTIRVKNQDVIILGGIEESSTNNSGSGVPFLARVPIIKWFFSKRTRTASKSKLSVLIKPTIIN